MQQFVDESIERASDLCLLNLIEIRQLSEQALNLIDSHFRHADGRSRWVGACVLDAFAGTGALGWEAAGRGAAQVWFWDTEPAQIRALEGLDIRLPGLGVQAACQSALQPPRALHPMDLIFLDPPYGKGLVDKALHALATAGWIGVETRIYAETELGTGAPLGFHVCAERISASSCLRVLQSASET